MKRANYLLPRLLLCTSVLAACFTVSAQPAPTIIQAASFVPATPKEFEPFRVEVEFKQPYCASQEAPLFSKVKLDGRSLTLLLSYMGEGPCVTRRSFVVPGMAAGSYDVTVGMTGSYWANYPSGSREAVSVEQSTTPLTVKAVGSKVPIYTWISPLSPSKDAAAFLQLGAPGGATIQQGNVSIIARLGDYEFSAWLDDQSLPVGSVRLFRLTYPSPLRGQFATTSQGDAERLVSEGFGTDPGSPKIYVLPVKNGVCPLASLAVYRLFNPKAISHRYVTSLDAYSTLAANGFAPEGAVFCAAP